MRFNTMQEMYDYLEVHGIQIGKESLTGSKLAKDVMTYYAMHYRCPGDPGAQAFLQIALEDYVKAKCQRE